MYWKKAAIGGADWYSLVSRGLVIGGVVVLK